MTKIIPIAKRDNSTIIELLLFIVDYFQIIYIGYDRSFIIDIILLDIWKGYSKIKHLI